MYINIFTVQIPKIKHLIIILLQLIPGRIKRVSLIELKAMTCSRTMILDIIIDMYIYLNNQVYYVSL